MTTRYSDETLMAYVDHELDAPTSVALETAMQGDAALAERVARQRALRGRVSHAFDTVLDEPIPARLLAAAQAAAAGSPKVVPLAPAREERESRRAAGAGAAARYRWTQWSGIGGALAACLVLGVWLGRQHQLAVPGDALWASDSGQLVARGELAQALAGQLASRQTDDAAVRIGVSFVAKSGRYCRSFALAQAGQAGLACRAQDGSWRLPVLAQIEGSETASTGTYRQAASAMPPAVLRAIDEQLAGAPLDAEAERAAAQQGWKR